MIALMLHHPRVKALGLSIDGIAVRIEATVSYMRRPWHHAAHPRNRKTPLPILVLLIAQRGDDRVNKNRWGYQFTIGVARIDLIATKQHHLKINTNLWRSQPCTIGRLHGFA